jgi:hypothetical protein
LIGLYEWEEWEWNDCEEHRDVETAIAMPCLERLKIENCKLSHLPPGLASSKRHALRELYLYELSNLTHVENFPSVVKLDVFDCPELKRISGLAMLQKIRIVRCTKAGGSRRCHSTRQPCTGGRQNGDASRIPASCKPKVSRVGSRTLMAEPHDVSLQWHVGVRCAW